MMRFEVLSKEKQTLFVGKVASMYVDNISVREMAEKLNKPVSWIQEVMGLIRIYEQNRNA